MARTTNNILDNYELSLTLDRYQEIMHLPIAAFNGLNNPDEEPVYQCASIWKQSQRNELAQYLAAAEERREIELGYHLAPKYITAEEHEYDYNITLERKKLIQIGAKATTDIETVELTYRDLYDAIIDPVVLSVSTTVTDTSEIAVFYPGEDVRIRPSNVTINGGVATISIPRSRLVKTSLMDDREDYLFYSVDENFMEEVDVKRVYTSLASAVTLVWPSAQLAYMGVACPPSCSERTQTACASITGPRARRIAVIKAFPATFAGETPTGSHFQYGCVPELVRVSYLSGSRYSPNQELLTARYAHTLMATQPCSCPLVAQYWDEDRKEAEFVTPYGNTAGAQHAWMADSRAKIGIGGMLV